MSTTFASRWVVWSIVAATVVAGCASSGNDASTPAGSSPSQGEPVDTTPSSSGSDTTTDAPPFQATFGDGGTTDGGTGNDDPTKDPTPDGGAAQCIDNDDAGGSEGTAEKLPDTDDCDTTLKEVDGVANGGVDLDFYSLAAADKGISLSHPLGCDINADFSDDAAGTELCVYGRCQNGTDNAISGCDQGTPSTSDSGLQGCCAAAPGHAVPKWNCSGLNDSMNFIIEVHQIDNGELCLPYKLSYKF